MSKKIISVLLAMTLALGCCSALAENTKHERVYVVTKPDGTVKSITDNIRLENTDGLEELIDRTMLTSIENLGGKESFVLDGETLTWQAVEIVMNEATFAIRKSIGFGNGEAGAGDGLCDT